MNRKLLCSAYCCLLLFSASPPVVAAVNPITKTIDKAAQPQPVAATATDMSDKEIDADRLKLEARIADFLLQTAPEAVAALRNTYQDAATPQELDEWVKLVR